MVEKEKCWWRRKGMCSKPNYTVVSFFLCEYNGQQSVSRAPLFHSDDAEWPAHNAPCREVWPVSHNHTLCQARHLRRERSLLKKENHSPFLLVLINAHSSLTWSLCSALFFLYPNVKTVTLGFIFLLLYYILIICPSGLTCFTLQPDFTSSN